MARPEPKAKGVRPMVTTGLLIRMQVQSGREADVEAFLRNVMPAVEAEADTTALFAFQLGPSEFGIVNAFPNEAGLQAHIAGHAGQALSEQAAQLFSAPPSIEPIR